jgi:hypothetical protein
VEPIQERRVGGDTVARLIRRGFGVPAIPDGLELLAARRILPTNTGVKEQLECLGA